jgi:hypothetical protein
MYFAIHGLVLPGPSLRPMACSNATPFGFRQRATVLKKSP